MNLLLPIIITLAFVEEASLSKQLFSFFVLLQSRWSVLLSPGRKARLLEYNA
jgi:hypothetical protein